VQAWVAPAGRVGSRLPQTSFLAAAGTNGRRAESAVTVALAARTSRASPAFFSSHAAALGCNRPLLAHRLSLPARKVRRIKQIGLWRPTSVPNSQFPAAETPQGAVGVQRLAHGHHQQIVSLTSTLLARPRPLCTVYQTMYSPSSPP
jgi:hypothetical protein